MFVKCIIPRTPFITVKLYSSFSILLKYSKRDKDFDILKYDTQKLINFLNKIYYTVDFENFKLPDDVENDKIIDLNLVFNDKIQNFSTHYKYYYEDEKYNKTLSDRIIELYYKDKNSRDLDDLRERKIKKLFDKVKPYNIAIILFQNIKDRENFEKKFKKFNKNIKKFRENNKEVEIIDDISFTMLSNIGNRTAYRSGNFFNKFIEPFDIIWKNLNCHSFYRFFLIVFNTILTIILACFIFLLVVGSRIFVVYIQSVENNDQIINVLIYISKLIVPLIIGIYFV
jgi:hypothetical protein